MAVPSGLLYKHAEAIVRVATHTQDINQLDVDEEFTISVAAPDFDPSDDDLDDLREMARDSAIPHGLLLQYIDPSATEAGFRVQMK